MSGDGSGIQVTAQKIVVTVILKNFAKASRTARLGGGSPASRHDNAILSFSRALAGLMWRNSGALII